MPVVSWMWNHSLSPGCRLLNKHRLVPPGVKRVGSVATAEVTSQAAAWLGLQWVRNQGPPPPLLRGPRGFRLTDLSLPTHAPGRSPPSAGCLAHTSGLGQTWAKRGVGGGVAGVRGHHMQDTAGCLADDTSSRGFGVLNPPGFTLEKPPQLVSALPGGRELLEMWPAGHI